LTEVRTKSTGDGGSDGTGAGSATWSQRRKESLLGYALLAPAVIAVAAIILYPVGDAVRLSFYHSMLIEPGSRFIGLSNYRQLFDDPVFWQAARNTAVWTSANVVLQMALGTGLALLVNEGLRGRAIYRSIFLIPWIVPSVVAALIWRYMYDYNTGAINALLQKLGIISSYHDWLGQTSTAMGSVVVESVWKGTPFVMLLVLAALQAVPPDLYDAAAVDGATSWERFRYVVLPQIRPTLALAAALTIVYTVNNFNAIWLMTQGGPLHDTDILFTYAYKLAFTDFNFGLAAAASVLIFGVVALFAGLTLLLVGRSERAS
jgi:multiple sugar transport system permease protein